MVIEKPLLTMNSVGKIYRNHKNKMVGINDVNLTIHRGERCAIMGPSGSGKSTLLSVLGLLDQPSKGQYLFNGEDVSCIEKDRRAFIRNRHIGFIFQSFNLLPGLNALENVALPLFYRGIKKSAAHRQARQQLERVGLEDRLFFLPASLSGGQSQRVAIARALVGQPDLVLADEPTGNLDSANAKDIFNLLLNLNRCQNTTLVVVTHDDTLAKLMDRQLDVRAGQVCEIV